MARWVHKTDRTEVIDTDKLQLNKSMRLLSTDLGQQLMGNESEIKEKTTMTKKEIREKIGKMTWLQTRVALGAINEGKSLEGAIEIALTYD